MKTPLRIAIVCGALLLVPTTQAAIYIGSWKNTTFGSTGALKIDLTLKDSRAKGVLDVDGNVFGGADPPPIPFNFPFDPDKNGKFKITGTILGDLAGAYTTNGDLNVTITHIPGGFLTKVSIDSHIDLKLETFAATYQIFNSGGLYAEGTAAAHVHKAPAVKLAKTVNVDGKTGSTTAKVTSNTKIKKVVVGSPDGAKVTFTGDNPYLIKVGGLNQATTRVKFSVTNADKLTTTKTVKFIRTDLAPLLLDSLNTNP